MIVNWDLLKKRKGGMEKVCLFWIIFCELGAHADISTRKAISKSNKGANLSFPKKLPIG